MKTRIRGELDQTQATEIVKPNLTPIPRELTRIRNRFPGWTWDFEKNCLSREIFVGVTLIRNDEPLPAPVMSAVLVSPKEKKNPSTNPSPMEGKEFATLQKTSSKSLLATLNNTNQSEVRVDAANQNEAETFDETDSYITINNEIQDSETNNIISHANQECVFLSGHLGDQL